MDIFVGSLDTGATKIGLTKGSIQAAVESRMRSARLYNPDGLHYLYVNVHVVGGAFSSRLKLKKYVLDYASDESYTAVTWENAVTGTHGRDSSYILSSISEQMDQFLVEFLRVNEEACAKR